MHLYNHRAVDVREDALSGARGIHGGDDNSVACTHDEREIVHENERLVRALLSHSVHGGTQLRPISRIQHDIALGKPLRRVSGQLDPDVVQDLALQTLVK